WRSRWVLPAVPLLAACGVVQTVL
ncbi:MAG TPA: DUF3325 domain-containing protein, partial [Pseudomonas sp.]|nr:DUF3325 domain-containing protein [Pseudomonas sp.]